MTDDLPLALKRDENNVAPFMTWDLAAPGSDRTVLHCSCGLMSGECKRAGCPLKELTVTITDVNDGPSLHEVLMDAVRASGEVLYDVSPEANPPAWFPWERPPSESTS